MVHTAVRMLQRRVYKRNIRACTAFFLMCIILDLDDESLERAEVELAIWIRGEVLFALLLDEFTHGDAVSTDMLLDGAAVGVAELGEVIH